MSKFIDVEENDLVLLLRLKDEDLGPEQAEDFKEIVKNRTAKNIKGVVVNFSLVNYMSSIFLSALIEVLKDLKNRKIKFALAELNEKILEVLKATRLDEVFSIFGSSYEAYSSFKK